jgi:hypothetical protein
MASAFDIETQTATAGDLFYIESDLPAGVTITEYRRARPRRRSHWKRFKDLAGRGGAAAAHAS